MNPQQIDTLVRQQGPFVFERMFAMIEKVRERLDRVCLALGEARVPLKLCSHRRKDQVHLLDMMGVGLIDATWPEKFVPELGKRLQALLDDPDG